MTCEASGIGENVKYLVFGLSRNSRCLLLATVLHISKLVYLPLTTLELYVLQCAAVSDVRLTFRSGAFDTLQGDVLKGKIFDKGVLVRQSPGWYSLIGHSEESHCSTGVPVDRKASKSAFTRSRSSSETI